MVRQLVAPVLFVILAVAGCRQPGYFPMSDDSDWELVFRTVDVAGAETVEIKRVPGRLKVVTVAEDTALGRYRIAELSRDSVRLFTLYFQSRPGGMYMLVPWIAGDLYAGRNDWILLLARKLRPGKAWYGNAYHEQLFEVVAREAATVPAGRIPGCYRIAVRTEEDAWPGSLWFAPGIGPVKWEYRSTRSRDGISWERVETAELVSHTGTPEQ